MGDKSNRKDITRRMFKVSGDGDVARLLKMN